MADMTDEMTSGITRMRGGDPEKLATLEAEHQYYPHARG